MMNVKQSLVTRSKIGQWDSRDALELKIIRFAAFRHIVLQSIFRHFSYFHSRVIYALRKQAKLAQFNPGFIFVQADIHCQPYPQIWPQGAMHHFPCIKDIWSFREIPMDCCFILMDNVCHVLQWRLGSEREN